MDASDVSATHHIRQTPYTCDVRFTKHHRICITVIITQTIDLPNKTVQSGIFSKFIWDDVLKIVNNLDPFESKSESILKNYRKSSKSDCDHQKGRGGNLKEGLCLMNRKVSINQVLGKLN